MAFPLQFSPGTRFLDIRFSILMIVGVPQPQVCLHQLGLLRPGSNHWESLVRSQGGFVCGSSLISFLYISFLEGVKPPPAPLIRQWQISVLALLPLTPTFFFIFLFLSCTSDIRARDIHTAKLFAPFSWIRQVHKSCLHKEKVQSTQLQKCYLPRDLQCRDVPWRGQSKRLWISWTVRYYLRT